MTIADWVSNVQALNKKVFYKDYFSDDLLHQQFSIGSHNFYIEPNKRIGKNLVQYTFPSGKVICILGVTVLIDDSGRFKLCTHIPIREEHSALFDFVNKHAEILSKMFYVKKEHQMSFFRKCFLDNVYFKIREVNGKIEHEIILFRKIVNKNNGLNQPESHRSLSIELRDGKIEGEFIDLFKNNIKDKYGIDICDLEHLEEKLLLIEMVEI